MTAPRLWTLGREVAKGGTALVYEVHRTGAAPAVMKLSRWNEHEIRARFFLEAEVLRALGPPVTPAFIEHGLVDERPYVIMEHLSGETLAAWMSRVGDRGGLGEVVAILIRIAGALSGLHSAGYIHRDLKPENIAISSKGIRLLDFGLVKPIRAGASALTQIGSVVGTPHYLAPEQIKMGSTVDHRVDLYSFGVIAFEMLTGRPPFTGERRAIEYHHTVSRPPSIRETHAIPEAIEEIVQSCLAKQVEARPPTAEVLRGALSAALGQVGTLRGVVGGHEPVRESKPIGTSSQVALVWIEHGDPVVVTRAVTEGTGLVVHHRGAGILAAFTAQHEEAPLSVALNVCRALVGERRRFTVHLTVALVRRSAHGKPMVYGSELDHPEQWIPVAPYTGIVLTRAVADALPGAVTPAGDVPGFFRDSQRDRTDAADARIDPPLVGREGLVRSLVEALASARGMLIGVSGEAGSGKTRVLRVVVERLQAIGREVIHVIGHRRLSGDRPDDERLVIALGGGDHLADALSRAAARGAVLVIDDLPLFSASVRNLVLEPRVPMDRLVASTEQVFEAPEPGANRISVELPRLSYGDAAVLLRAMLQPARLIPDALVDRLTVRGTGNPRLLIGLARDIKRRGAIRRQVGGADWYVAVDELDTLLAPPGPSWFASRILEDLPVELIPVVRMSAALGPRFTAEEVAAATGVSDLAPRLSVLVHEHLFSERNGWYEFEDASLQEAIYDHALDERELVHARVYRYLLTSRDRNLIGRLARLAYHAAGAGDRATAAASWAALARHAVRAGDADRSEEILTRLLAYLGGACPPEVQEVLAGLDPT